jgi:hypothetical protein
MSRKRILFAVVAGAALVAAVVAGSVHWTRSHAKAAAPAKFMPVPEGTERLNTLESYWNTRITYPTGHFNPAWLRGATGGAHPEPRPGRVHRIELDVAWAAARADDGVYRLLRLHED